MFFLLNSDVFNAEQEGMGAMLKMVEEAKPEDVAIMIEGAAAMSAVPNNIALPALQ